MDGTAFLYASGNSKAFELFIVFLFLDIILAWDSIDPASMQILFFGNREI